MISSSRNSRIKLARALTGRSKDRREAEAFLAEGVRLVEEALAGGWPFRFVLHSASLSERASRLVRRLQERGIETEEVESRLLASLSDTETPQGILAVLASAQPPQPRELGYVLIADAVRDPGNLGTLLRSAEAAGMDAVFATPGTADAFSPKVVRAGMGAHFRLPIYEIKWEEIRTQVAAYHWNVYLADMHGRSCWETEFRPPLALIIGGEAEGATDAARTLIAQPVSIPMGGGAESLNAAVAGSVLMFEVMRQAATDRR
jgi:TrmH family RNA methyltransferase